MISAILFSLLTWLGDFSQAKIEATQQHKLIVLNFSGSDWCGPCIQLKKDIFESKEFISFSESHLILLRADFPRLKKNQLPKEQQDKNDALAEKYNPNGEFPLTILLSQEGKVLREWKGYQGNKEQFIAEIKSFR